jgi:hypothetical protein
MLGKENDNEDIGRKGFLQGNKNTGETGRKRRVANFFMYFLLMYSTYNNSTIQMQMFFQKVSTEITVLLYIKVCKKSCNVTFWV